MSHSADIQYWLHYMTALDISYFWWLSEFLWSWISLLWDGETLLICTVLCCSEYNINTQGGRQSFSKIFALSKSTEPHIERRCFYAWEGEENIPKVQVTSHGKNNFFHPQFPFHFYSVIPSNNYLFSQIMVCTWIKIQICLCKQLMFFLRNLKIFYAALFYQDHYF